MSNTEAWVGSWRPHKPRGPIAALYGSPGPKYALPNLTGVSKRDPTKYKAPMFSFGTRLNQPKYDCSPGPKYLIPSNVTRQGKGGTPAFSLHSRTKEPGSFQGPGPCTYSPEHSRKLIFPSAPAFSLSGTIKTNSSSQIPGPASYTLPPMLGSKTVVIPAAPAYSLCGRSKSGSFHEDLKKTPGPAAYKLVDPCFYQEKSPQYSITGRNFPPDENTQKPGPGAHHPERVFLTRPKAPSFTFGLRHSQYISPLIVNETE